MLNTGSGMTASNPRTSVLGPARDVQHRGMTVVVPLTNDSRHTPLQQNVGTWSQVDMGPRTQAWPKIGFSRALELAKKAAWANFVEEVWEKPRRSRLLCPVGLPPIGCPPARRRCFSPHSPGSSGNLGVDERRTPVHDDAA